MKRLLRISISMLLVCLFCANGVTAAAATMRAYSVGTNYGSGNIDTSEDATYARAAYSDCGYSSSVNTTPTATTLKGKYSGGSYIMSSDILFFSGHGNYDHIGFNWKQKGGDYDTGINWEGNTTKYAGIKNRVGSTQLITFAACLTASNGDTNISNNAVEYGAETAVGWSEEVLSGSHSNWLERYHDYLVDGYSVGEAVEYANSFTYLPGSHVKDVVIYGNEDLVINNSGRAIRSGDSELNHLSVSPLMIQALDEESCVADAICTISDSNPEFSIDDYVIETHRICDGTETIDLTRKIGEYITNSGYVIHVKDGVIQSIIDNSIQLTDNQELQITSETESVPLIDLEELALQNAANETIASSLKEIKGQRLYHYFDLASNTKYILVYTSYYYNGTTGVGVDLYQMGIG